MKDFKRYESLRRFIESHSIALIEESLATNSKNAEYTLLYLDLLSCPYISNGCKTKLIELCGLEGKVKQSEFLAVNDYWFTKWVGFDLAEELDRKRSLEVY